jgi:YidC/Oxa1 family membrane protein insertase
MNAILILYTFFGNNIGWAIIVLTIILKLLLFPFTRSQLESSRKIKVIQPQLEKLQKKYKKNPKKLQEEQLKLYRKVGYNPLGCFTSILIPLPILIAIYQAVKLFSAGEVTGIYQFVRDLLGANGSININTYFYFLDLSKAYLPVAKDFGYISLEAFPYLILVVLTGLSQYLSVKISSKQQEVDSKVGSGSGGRNKKKSSEDDMAASMAKSMSLTFPMMTTMVALSMPSGVALYWVVQSLITVSTHLVYNKLKNRKK